MLGENNNPSVNEDAELDVFEFPVLFDDLSYMPLTGEWAAPSDDRPQGSMLYHTVNVAHKVAKFGGIAVVLTHPTDEKIPVGYSGIDKIEWQEAFIRHTSNYSDVLTFSEMGDFARGRNEVQVDITQAGEEYIFHLMMDVRLAPWCAWACVRPWACCERVANDWLCSGATVLDLPQRRGNQRKAHRDRPSLSRL